VHRGGGLALARLATLIFTQPVQGAAGRPRMQPTRHRMFDRTGLMRQGGEAVLRDVFRGVRFAENPQGRAICHVGVA
jgi:hypothetical protein